MCKLIYFWSIDLSMKVLVKGCQRCWLHKATHLRTHRSIFWRKKFFSYGNLKTLSDTSLYVIGWELRKINRQQQNVQVIVSAEMKFRTRPGCCGRSDYHHERNNLFGSSDKRRRLRPHYIQQLLAIVSVIFWLHFRDSEGDPL